MDCWHCVRRALHLQLLRIKLRRRARSLLLECWRRRSRFLMLRTAQCKHRELRRRRVLAQQVRSLVLDCWRKRARSLMGCWRCGKQVLLRLLEIVGCAPKRTTELLRVNLMKRAR